MASSTNGAVKAPKNPGGGVGAGGTNEGAIAAKASKGSKPSVVKPIVPVIPLPYVQMQRRKAARIASMTPAPQVSPVMPPEASLPELSPPEVSPPRVSAPEVSAPEATTNGAQPVREEAPVQLEASIPQPQNSQPVSSQLDDSQPAYSEPGFSLSEPSQPQPSHFESGYRQAATSPTDIESPLLTTRSELNEHNLSDNSTAPSVTTQAPEQIADIHTSATTPLVAEASRSIDLAGPTLGVHMIESVNAEPVELPTKDREGMIAGTPVADQQPSVASPTRYHMVPPFRPASGENAGVRSSWNRPPHGHRQGSGSPLLGGFPDSGHSSPAPPLSGGFAPPSGLGFPEGRAPFMGQGASGGYLPPVMGYGHDMGHMHMNGYGRPVTVFPSPVDAYYPGHNYGPSTPHSFHGSQASASADDTSVYGRSHPLALNANGSGGPADDHGIAGAFGGHGLHKMMHAAMPPPHFMPGMMGVSDADGLNAYIQSLCFDPEFSDCILELRFEGDKAPPVRIPGHRLIFARSPVLRGIINADRSSAASPSLRLLTLRADNKYVRPDSFYLATQTLYGVPLFDIPPSPSLKPNMAGSHADRFDFALGYAASGHLLRWEPVVVRGMEMASQLLDWSTIEKALEFALGEMPSRGAVDFNTSLLPYGEPIKILLNDIITFIVNNFPQNFVLDTSVSDPEKYARLPEISAPSMRNSAPIAHGTSIHFGPGRRSGNRLSQIKFGDLSPALGDGLSRMQEGSRPASYTILSRVLLNLPYIFLKPALESTGGGNVNGWASAEARHQLMRDVVVEREARRRRALDAVLSGRVALASGIKRALQSPHARSVDEWDTLAWHEETVLYPNADIPILQRKWVPLEAPEHGANGFAETEAPIYA